MSKHYHYFKKGNFFPEWTTICLLTVSPYQKSIDECGYAKMLFLIKFSSTPIRNATLKYLTLEKK